MSKYILKNGILLDGTKEMVPRSGLTICVEDGLITAVQEQGVVSGDHQEIDLNGQYILPGLINMHVHIPATGKPSKSTSNPKKLVAIMTGNALMRKISYKLCARYVLPELYGGVTTIRTVGGILDYDSKLRDEIAAGKAAGPRIIASNMAISVPGGHMAGSLAYEARSAEEAKELVGRIADSGADLIKLMITGGVLDAKKRGEPGELKMPAEYVKAACEEAHKRGLIVAAHVESTEGVRIALENGVDTIEHGALPDDEIMELFQARGVSHICTLSPALPYALFDQKISHATDDQKFNGDLVFRGIIECAKRCLDAGVPVGLGTDTGCPYVTHYDMWRELQYFRTYCGVSAAFALYTATLGNAKILGLDKEIGSIEVGKSADLIVCRENPLQDLRALKNLSLVMARGDLVDISRLKKLPEVESELEKFENVHHKAHP